MFRSAWSNGGVFAGVDVLLSILQSGIVEPASRHSSKHAGSCAGLPRAVVVTAPKPRLIFASEAAVTCSTSPVSSSMTRTAIRGSPCWIDCSRNGSERTCGRHCRRELPGIAVEYRCGAPRAAERIRTRIADFADRLDEILPIYLVLTHADQIPSFSAFWAGDCNREEACLGASFADGDERLEYEPAKAIAREMDIVGDAIHARAIDRLGREGDPSRCARFFLFPSELKRLSAPLAPEFVEGLGQGGASSEHGISEVLLLSAFPRWRPQASPRERERSAFAGDFFRLVASPIRDLARPTALAKRKRGRSNCGLR